jgi:hypothetical protein
MLTLLLPMTISMRNDWVSHASPIVFQTACILSSYMIQEDQGGYRRARNTGLLEIVLASANCRKTTHPGWGLTRVGVHGDAVTVDFAITKYDGLVMLQGRSLLMERSLVRDFTRPQVDTGKYVIEIDLYPFVRPCACCSVKS